MPLWNLNLNSFQWKDASVWIFCFASGLHETNSTFCQVCSSWKNGSCFFFQFFRAVLQVILLVMNETVKNHSLFAVSVSVMNLQTPCNWAALQVQRMCSFGFKSAQTRVQKLEEAHTTQTCPQVSSWSAAMWSLQDGGVSWVLVCNQTLRPSGLPQHALSKQRMLSL